ncbi:1-(5-phosphoribosyl)-5-[(5-phosphoribosylamino)methylideneamino] imidazole-4-carboxamide isomerase [Reichenbachiella agarivorans]|uniref:1-(5-phosphoribosyl)-5-[(5-phosphoribosylamino)methylideneamino] imidazole-4-carboxamide isomerase n=1 Tax=Reichenbachiella agarivorans TaxID=2979464 RepID=A0ABY6CSX8_9BACT|nr:1-(5-phosphoribosyl)-5-[(5-phosphoribosylamino)methylideneamino] imidazole-4-carboxamide isomerase [Reichenbachiella agarivorans]UXP33627.1 1-(5-phosphoribosyl)-5-[(5-phosphoribosylamino)methylideneamino] imidazole-4-carboxamide isomerase [Reichenbachiella agarivorans]
MQLVPSIAIKDGKVVRMTQDDFSSAKVYDQNPIDLAQQFKDHGVQRIHMVDLDGAKKGKVINYHILEAVVGHTELAVNFTGGVHTDGDITKIFESGAESVTCATMAVYAKDTFASWIMSYGREKIALAADCLDGMIRVGGWQKNTELSLSEHVSFFYERGLKYLKTTDISKEGVLKGPSFEIYEQILKDYPGIFLFASGGIRDLKDLERLEKMGTHGAVFGRAFFEGHITLKDIEAFIAKS